MTTRKIAIFSGADRVGKSTLISAMHQHLGEDACEVVHLSEPPGDQDNIFDINRECVGQWVASGKKWLLFDRFYVCSFILEQFRRNNHGHLDDIIDLELELLQCSDTFNVIHVSVDRPWSWSAKHHLIELKELFPQAAPWRIRDEYVARMKEHKEYYSKLYEFYEHTTAFPNVVHCGEYYPDADLEVAALLNSINNALK